jgi:hypothetical protein
MTALGRPDQGERRAERFPAWAVLLHGLAGLATFILVLITATIVSQG